MVKLAEGRLQLLGQRHDDEHRGMEQYLGERDVRPPPGVVQNNDYSNPLLRTTNIALAAVGLGISTVCVMIRLYTKVWIVRKLWWDDLCISVAWGFAAAGQALIINAYAHAWLGIHLWDLTPHMRTGYRKTALAFWVIFTAGLAFTKFALLMLYGTLFRSTGLRTFILSLTAATIAAYTIAFALALLFVCRPIRQAWDGSIPGSCYERGNIHVATTIANLISDIILILIPIPMVRELRLPTLQKIGVMLMFGVGSLTIIISMIRTGTSIPLIGSMDGSYKISLPIIFMQVPEPSLPRLSCLNTDASVIPSIIEANFMIVCGTLPYIRRFLRYHWPSLIGRSSTTETRSTTEKSSKPKRSNGPVPPQSEVDVEGAVPSIPRLDSSALLQTIDLQYLPAARLDPNT
ncbi:hypothetical protein BJX61DRAFT_545024 [Aspergillus egyptiacus]|nr:hypothetical protein BJX61DRAFT_545024 [Aspergillus egyptiacus]